MGTQIIQRDDLENLRSEMEAMFALSGPEDDDEGNDLIFEDEDEFDLDDLDDLDDFDNFDDDDF